MSESLQQETWKQRNTARLWKWESSNPSNENHENNETLQDYANDNIRIPPTKYSMQVTMSKLYQRKTRKQRKTTRLCKWQCQNPTNEKLENNEKLQDYASDNVKTLPTKNSKTTKNYKTMQVTMSKPYQRKTRKQRKTTRLCKWQCQNPTNEKLENNEKLQDYGMRISETFQRKTQKQQKTSTFICTILKYYFLQ